MNIFPYEDLFLNSRKIVLFAIFFTVVVCNAQTQTVSPLTLEQMLAMAKKMSVTAKKAQSVYHQAVLENEIYKANDLPSFSLSLIPGRYSRNIVQRYVSELNQDVYRTQQTFFSSGRLILNQKVGFTGGNISLYSDLQAYRTFNDNGYTQFTAIPIGFTYSQQLLGYNPYKWEKRIEDERLRHAKALFSYTIEGISADVATLYADGLYAQKQVALAKESVAMHDTLLQKGILLERLGRLTQSSLLLLKLEKSKAEKFLIEAENNKRNRLRILCDYVGLPSNDNLHLMVPPLPTPIQLKEQDVVNLSTINNPLLYERSVAILSAEQKIDKTKKERYAEASVEITVGFNQTGRTFSEAYRHPLRQDIVSIGLNIPIVDWGVRKRKMQRAKEELFIARLDKEEALKQIQREVLALYSSYHLHIKTTTLAQENIALARILLSESYERFLIGKEDMEIVLKANQSLHEAELNYLQSLGETLHNYFLLRQYSLYDWGKGSFIHSE